MKLIEIMAKQKEWPAIAVGAVQDEDGMICYFGEGSVPEFFDGQWFTFGEKSWVHVCTCQHRTASDHRTAIVLKSDMVVAA
jgi:hypothetical protein